MSGYIGTQPVPQATQTRDSFTATSGQTSFATGGYTPNFLDVYLNGVKLAAADYTASNGSDVVLASGAATGDILEVVAFTTFNSASSSIDDNGNATAITIDSNENVLIGTTTYDSSNVGVLAGSNGALFATRSGNQPATFNRKTNDGEIVSLQKDGTTVGSIGVGSSGLTIGKGDTGFRFADGADAINPWNLSSNVARDGNISLGENGGRFKDLYLSGGVYLGGTGAANKLDDYEEGTWDAGAWSSQSNKYVKVGNLVMLTLDVVGPLSGTISQVTLPFTATGTSGTGIYSSNVNFSSGYTVASLVVAGTQGYLRQCGDNIAFAALGVGQNGILHATITYNTTQ